MGYRIEAFLDSGAPALRIRDIESNQLALDWRADQSISASQQWQQLFRKLILLSCKQDINVRLFKLEQSTGD